MEKADFRMQGESRCHEKRHVFARTGSGFETTLQKEFGSVSGADLGVVGWVETELEELGLLMSSSDLACDGNPKRSCVRIGMLS
jgi:hypothetical protein